MFKVAAALTLIAGLAGCASQKLEDYSRESPALDLREYLNGPLTATGIFFGYSGRADLRFVVDLDGTWDGDTGTLVERFRYSGGTTDERIWTLRFSDDQNFTGTADDVVGEAVGRQAGNAATMTYQLRLPRGDGEIVVTLEDWFYLQEDGTLINRAEMRKFGLPVGDLIVVFRKLPQ